MRIARTLLSAVVYGVLGLLAVTGVAISALALYARAGSGGKWVAARLVRIADEAVAGRLELQGIEVLPRGGVEIRGFRAYDPDGDLVLDVDRAFVTVDVTRLRFKVVGVALEVEGGSVLIAEKADGLSIARAFAPAHPSPPQPKERRELLGMGGWTVRLSRLSIRDTDLWWQGRAGETRLEAHDVSVRGRALAAPGRARVELRLDGALDAPLDAPVSIELRGLLDGDLARVPVLRATVGGTQLEGLGEANLRRLTGRFAVVRAGLDRSQARALVPAVPAGQDLALQAYAEAGGGIATAAAHVEPRGAAAEGGGDAAVAVRLDGARALGFDVATHALDPAALYDLAPRGRITLTAHGGAAGTDLDALRGAVELSLAPSRLRGGTLGPVQATVRVDRGSWDVPSLSLRAPGLRIQGAGRWRQGGIVSGGFTLDGDDLSTAGSNLSALLATPLPPLAGRIHAEVSADGTAAAPHLTAAVTAPSARLAEIAVTGLKADVEVRGPFRPGQLGVVARADQVASGGEPVARALSLRAELAPPRPGAAAPVRLSASAVVPQLGKEPVEVQAAGVVAPERTSLRLDTLALGYPGTRYQLEAPATVTFEGPRVDRLALQAGPRRIVVEGGLSRRELDAHLTVERLDLAALPAGLLPAGEGIAGELSADVHAAGPATRPVLAGHVALTGGAFRGEQGVAAEGDVRWDLGARRVQGKLSAAQEAMRLVVEADLPMPLAGRTDEPLRASVRVDELAVGRLLALSGQSMPARGRLSVMARLEGTARAPAAHLEVALADGAYADLEGVAVTAVVEAARRTTVRAEASLSGGAAARLSGEVPLDLAELLVRPGPTARALRDARLAATVEVLGLELARVSGHLGVPADLAGRVTGAVRLSGRLAAPRGTAALELEDGAYRGYRPVALRLTAEARDDAVVAHGAVRLAAQEPVTVEAALRAPLERLTSAGGLRSAALSLDAVVPHLDLAAAAGSSSPVALSGLVEARVRAQGSLGRPELTAELSGRSVSIEGRPLGDAHLAARAGGDRLSAELTLAPKAGGNLRATLDATAPVSLDLTGEQLARAPAQAALHATAVDLGFLPAVLLAVRAASGKLEADLTAKGQLGSLAPRGTIRVEGGRVAVAEYGDWTGIAMDAAVTDDAVELKRFVAMRGKGTLSVDAALRGLTTPRAKLDGKITTRDLTLVRAGMDVVTLTNLDVKVDGAYENRTLDVKFDVSPTTLRLPDKLPRPLQSLERRPDIVVGKKPPKKERVASAAPPTKAIALKARLVAPGRLRVVEASPRVDLELKADVTYERSGGGAEYMSGSVQTVRGEVAPISGRRFDVRRGRVTFTGGPPQAALVDAEAVYDNPTAAVTVNISGPLTHPQVKMTSNPPLDESQIAMLIATGGTELKAGGGANISSLQDASSIGFAVFNSLIRDRLPIDTNIVFDASTSAARVGYFLPGTSIYVGYIRRLEPPRTDQTENSNEVQLQYAISPRWTLEGRWGDAGVGAASLIWSKDY